MNGAFCFLLTPLAGELLTYSGDDFYDVALSRISCFLLILSALLPGSRLISKYSRGRIDQSLGAVLARSWHDARPGGALSGAAIAGHCR